MPVSVSFVLKTAMMVTLLVTVYYTMTAEADKARKVKYYEDMKNIAEYVESHAMKALEQAYTYNVNSSQVLLLPSIRIPYQVSIACSGNWLTITADSGLGRKHVVYDYFNCSRVEASGSVVEGEHCLKVEKLNSTNVKIMLVNKCD